VQLAQELVQRARQEGVSLVGPDGLLAGVTRTVLQTALDAEMSEHLGMSKATRSSTPRATIATALHRRPCTPRSDQCPSTCPATGKAPLSRTSCPSTPVGSKLSMGPSSRWICQGIDHG
jgi:hypothetical protein